MGPTPDFSFAEWRQQLDLNLNTTFFGVQAQLEKKCSSRTPVALSRSGRGERCSRGGQLAAYCASKAGVVALTQAIADETKGTGVTANVVLPSVIDTPANREAMGADQAAQWVKPESLAEVICFFGVGCC